MVKVDRRSLRSQESIKGAFIALLAEKSFDEITIQDIADKANVGRRTIYLHYLDKYDLLDRLIEEYISELRRLCQSSSDLSFVDAMRIWFEFFEQNYSFFATILASKGASSFRSGFIKLVSEELEGELDVAEGINKGFSKDIVRKFMVTATVGIIESYFTKEITDPIDVVSEQVGRLLERNL
ncbi:TetR/AcrR family transcriptional regulator [Paenibacillus glucanolyticus]|jgi:AcrR family transcriptional regulator|uniref:TetR family transcriptional regulator n=1 Tax=Paenibacillus glucanolyticus TaxID=59843 RepID=A0A163DKX3_9BACL|nr:MULTISPECIES: TetR/AcrR family transcriptional regulator [Paenibacillus]MCA4752256.1 TetR/AcrR family transcriptional regulator [Mycolicibacterium fortuitum]AVV58362.1 TetR/AcrR family transcriptional regulator [Paenibacillus glucanolyticus]AWP27523.1 TetR family transcriptional regulator [Paenibacillus sp. Cedars]ETT42579.1 TetR family transcriptional regulator [Paenibacillus sp. FSL R5-808]KZS43297.1 TetR family transcriptional regulator [Paenibacillus glucanolyticus]